MMYPETWGWICAFTYPSSVATHSLCTGTSRCSTLVTNTVGGGGAAGAALLLLHPLTASRANEKIAPTLANIGFTSNDRSWMVFIKVCHCTTASQAVALLEFA